MNAEETKALLVRFYDALARRDGAAMAALYAPNARFEDEVYRLEGPDVGKMWTGLLSRAKTLSVSYTIARAGSGTGTVELTARYLYGGRPVVNVILSELELEDGRIVRQRDRFDFPRWAAQALGIPGRLFGRFEWFRRAVSRKAAARVGVPPKEKPAKR
ncbi:MAG TPA: nuclear transport factor 2 family protein [Thermoanaerobaculia bacterium]|nr:nuclear transport factor 2 family protein [Thermoanaerobaculia bacterium]